MHRYWFVAIALYVSLIWWQGGLIAGAEATLRGDALPRWQLASYYGDAGEYVALASGEESIAPYHYRVLPIWLVQAIGLPAPVGFLLLNSTAALLTALLFTRYLLHCYSLSPDLALLGGALAITMLPMARTLPFPMIDPLAHLWAMCIVYAVATRNAPAFIAASIAGVATKETLAIGALLWMIAVPRWQSFPIAAVPVAVFVGIRLAMGGAAFEANYGYDVAAGELPDYWTRIYTDPVGLLYRVLSAFGLLWVGVLAIPRHRLLREQWIAIPLVILAAVLLSSRVARPLGIVFPVVLPGALLLLQHAVQLRNCPRNKLVCSGTQPDS
jgi:branched-subunit amino acid transport protein